MKNIILSTLALAAIISFTACKKCSTCTTLVGEEYRFANGDELTVSTGEARYAGAIYEAGDSFTIAEDSTVYLNGLRFEGDGQVGLSETFCGKGATYSDQSNRYKIMGWACAEE